MKYTDNSLNILTTISYKGIGRAWINQNLKGNEPIELLVELISKRDTSVTEKDFFQRRANIEQQVIALKEENCDGLVALGDEKFPSYRGKVKDADKPIYLFYKGDLSLLDKESQNIAVIGVLQPDKDTEADERNVVHQLVKQGATIVSGLAEGCDSIAHHQTLCSKGATVAILPSPLNNIIPNSKIPLANAIIERGGLIVSEYYTQARGREQSSRYVERDRLQALYSDMVLLTSSYAKNDLGNDCGSRHAMAKAKDYGLHRGVIYSQTRNNHNPKYDLNRQIINELPKPFIIDPNNYKKDVQELFTKLNCNQFVEQKSLF
ncbi:MAG: DNA-processing protein DprA [Moraxellaceae bacterium]|nr:DNA-processing protein DprA [Moraxellaceae bacterium]